MTSTPDQPMPTARVNEWLGSLRPDRAAEQLVVGELTKEPGLIPALFTGLDEPQCQESADAYWGGPRSTILMRYRCWPARWQPTLSIWPFPRLRSPSRPTR